MKKLFYGVSLLAMMLVITNELNAQNFTNNTGGTYTVGTSGTIRMRSNGGQFNGSAQLGANQSTPIPGTVIWICSNTMNIQGGVYYTNLGTEGAGTKNFLGNVYISGTYTPTGGDREYGTNTVFYNGASAQTIAGENGTNGGGYYDLNLSGAGAKSISAGTTVVVTNGFALTNTSGTFTNGGTINLGSAASTADAAIVNDGTFNYGTGDFTASAIITNNGTMTLSSGDFASTANITNNGTFTGGAGTLSNTTTFTNNSGGAGGSVTVGAGVWSLNNFTNTSGGFSIPDGSTVNLAGDITRTAGIFTFGCTSNFNYTGGAQTILATDPVNFASYGNLSLAGTADKTAGGNLTICNNFATTRELEMAPGANDYILSMLNTSGTASVTYTGNVEVRGKMRWNNMSNSTAYTFNNANTNVTFSAAPTWYQLDIRQQTNPTLENNFNIATDVRRRVLADFNGTGSISNLVIGWEATDEDASFAAADETKLRFAQGFDAGQPMEKIARAGATYNRTNVTSTPRSLTYGGGSGPGLNLVAAIVPGNPRAQQMVTGSEIVLTTTPQTIYSITNGRWTNPATWDIGLPPTAEDNVEIRNVVWTGIDQAVFGGSAYTTDENNGTPSANSITIANISGSALVIGNQDASMSGEYVFTTKVDPLTGTNIGIFNNNTTANTGDGNTNSATGLNGIWIRPAANGITPVLGAYQLTNQGAVYNGSFLDIGICQ